MDVPLKDTGADLTTEQLQIFRHVATLLASPVESAQTLANTLSACLPALGDFGCVDVVVENRTHRAAFAHPDPNTEALLLAAQWLPQEHAGLLVSALSSGKPSLQTDIDDNWYRNAAVDDERLAILRQLAFRSMLSVPIFYGKKLVGSLTLFMGRSGRQHSDADVSFAMELAALAAPVLNSIGLLERQRSIEIALRQNEAYLASIFEQTSAGIAEADAEGCLIRVNARYCQLLSRNSDALIGKCIWDLTHPDDVLRNSPLFENALQNDVPFEIEARYLRPDGSSIWVSKAVSRIGASDAGKSASVLAIVLDITERKRAEEELAEMVNRLRFTLDAAEMGDWDLDLTNDKAFRSLRHDQCFGYTEPIPDWGFEIFIAHVHPDDREFVAQQFRTALADLTDWHFECRVVWPDQSVHWIAAHGSIYHVDASPTRMSGIVFDITERKKIEEELRKADRRKDEFLAMLAHELRNPLAPIGAAADLLRLARLDEERVAQTSAIISRQVRHMTGLIDDLLDVSRVTRGLVTLDKTALDAKRIVSDAMEQVRPLIEARHHHVMVHTPPEPAYVSGDQKRLVQVVANLLNNAAKYTPEGGNIVFSTDVQDGLVMFTVSDNGIGMAPELVERAFELFAQAERSADRAQGGLGLGLALVKNLVKLHDGQVTAFSEGLGKGSKFTVSLPIIKAPANATRFQRDETKPGRQNPPLKIMVVDDNVDAAQMLAMFLETLGHQIFIEHDSANVLARAEIISPDLCLLDIGLPDMDGHELARRFRARPETADIILIAVTGYGQEQDRKNIFGAGFDHHFVKPVDTARLTGLLTDIGKK